MQKSAMQENISFQTDSASLIRKIPQLTNKVLNNILVLKTGGKIVLVRLEEINWAESARNSVRLHVGSASYSVRGSLEKLEGILTNRFLRINRSTVVNLYEVQELQTWFHGNLRVVLRDGSLHVLSPNYKKHFFETLGNPFG